MQPDVVQILLTLNAEFYQTFGGAFAATRQRVQPGVRRVVDALPVQGDWLDLGCGSGSLAAAWAARPGRHGSYTGVDISLALLQEAEKAVVGSRQPGVEIHFHHIDLAAQDWVQELGDQEYDIGVAFAVLHHLPGFRLRRRLLQDVHGLLKAGGIFYHSVWQFQHSARLMERRLPWSTVHLSPEQVEQGDALLDWRYALPGQVEQVGYRYVHLFTHEELHTLAEECGFAIEETFESDGEGGRLGLYQCWRRLG